MRLQGVLPLLDDLPLQSDDDDDDEEEDTSDSDVDDTDSDEDNDGGVRTTGSFLYEENRVDKDIMLVQF